MDQIRICECIICGELYFRIDDVVTVHCFVPGFGYKTYHGRIKSFNDARCLILDISDRFHSTEIEISISDIKNIYEYEKGE